MLLQWGACIIPVCDCAAGNSCNYMRVFMFHELVLTCRLVWHWWIMQVDLTLVWQLRAAHQ